MGRATELLAMPTQFLVAGGARRRRIAFALVGALAAAAAVGAGGAVFVMESSKGVALHKEWGSFQSCMLGAPLKPEERASERFRLLALTQAATPLDKRPVGGGQAWPSSCLSPLSAVIENAPRAPSGGDELAKSGTALAKAITSGTLVASAKLVDDMWKAASTATLKDAPGAANPTTPSQLVPLYSTTAFRAQPRPLGDFALGAIRTESSAPTRPRFVIDDGSTEKGSTFCEVEPGSTATLRCKPLAPDVAKFSPKLRLIGTSGEPASIPLLFAGERGKSTSIFAELSTPVVPKVGATVLGASALAGGRVRLLARKGATTSVFEMGGGAKPTESKLREMTDGTLAGDYVVKQTPSSHLALQRGTTPALDVGELPDGLASVQDSDDRAAFCGASGTEVVRVRGSRNDFVTVGIGGKWSPPQKIGRTDLLSCADGVGVLATVARTDNGGRIHATMRIDRCTSAGCKPSQLSHYDMVSGIAELLPTSASAFSMTVAGSRVFVAWVTSLGDLRVRSGSVDTIATAHDVVVNEGVLDAPSATEVSLVPSTSGTLLFARSSDGVRAYAFGMDGTLTPAKVEL
jgi:hypothetical protein